MSSPDAPARLLTCLEAEAQRYGELLESCRAHREALVSSRVARVEATLRRQLEAMAACNQASVARHAATQELAAELGLDGARGTGELLAALPDETAAPLAAPYARMRDLSVRLARENDENRRISEHRLDLLQGDFASLQRLANRAAGRPEAEREGSLLSLRA